MTAGHVADDAARRAYLARRALELRERRERLRGAPRVVSDGDPLVIRTGRARGTSIVEAKSPTLVWYAHQLRAELLDPTKSADHELDRRSLEAIRVELHSRGLAHLLNKRDR